jgi:ribosomal protein L5
MTENLMRKPFISKVLLSAGANGPDLVKAKKLLDLLSNSNAHIIKSGPKLRIPELGVKPDMELGTRVTLRDNRALMLLRRLLGAVDNTLTIKQVSPNHFSFGIKEYIDIPDMEYIREIGIRGFNVTVVFERAGVRIKNKKIKRGTLRRVQMVDPKEIIQYMEDNFKTKFV